MKLKSSNYLFTLCVLIGCGIVVCGQSGQTTLKGIVVDPNDARVQRVQVTVESKTIKRTAETDENGTFSVEVPPGIYRVVLQFAGFKVAKLKKVRVPDGGSEIKVTLQVEPMKNVKCPKGKTCILL